MERTLEPEVMDSPAEADEYADLEYVEPNVAFVERLCALGARGRMLDVGTGPGHVPLRVCAAIADARVVGVDLSPHMLAVADRKRAASPYADRIELRVADAKGLDFDAASFDAVFSNTILHHIPDPRPFLAEARRVLRPGGVLLIRDLYRPDTPAAADALVALHAAGATPAQQELFRASLHAALTPDELRAAADAAGLADAEITIDSDRHVSLQIAAR
jgi:ubiquinone/menaquinone biosynthesis C-methylase UbiE